MCVCVRACVLACVSTTPSKHVRVRGWGSSTVAHVLKYLKNSIPRTSTPINGCHIPHHFYVHYFAKFIFCTVMRLLAS